MWLKLRIVFTVLSALCIAAVIPFGAFLGWTWAGISALSAFVFYALMLLCKGKQPQEEQLPVEERDEPKDETNESNE